MMKTEHLNLSVILALGTYSLCDLVLARSFYTYTGSLKMQYFRNFYWKRRLIHMEKSYLWKVVIKSKFLFYTPFIYISRYKKL